MKKTKRRYTNRAELKNWLELVGQEASNSVWLIANTQRMSKEFIHKHKYSRDLGTGSTRSPQFELRFTQTNLYYTKKNIYPR